MPRTPTHLTTSKPYLLLTIYSYLTPYHLSTHIATLNHKTRLLLLQNCQKYLLKSAKTSVKINEEIFIKNQKISSFCIALYD
jgi:hypothetical protein